MEFMPTRSPQPFTNSPILLQVNQYIQMTSKQVRERLREILKPNDLGPVAEGFTINKLEALLDSVREEYKGRIEAVCHEITDELGEGEATDAALIFRDKLLKNL